MGTKDNDRWTNYSIVVISFIALSSFCVGLVDGIIGPTMPDLTHKFNLTIEEYSRPLSSKGLIILIALPVAGIILDNAYSKIELAFSVNILILGAAISLVPWFGSLIVLGFLYGIVGFSYANLWIYAALYAVRSHRKDAPWLLTLLGVVYTSSKIILPYLCAPFITDINIHHDKAIFFKNLRFKPSQVNGSLPEKLHVIGPLKDSEWNNLVYVPFLITTIICIIGAVGFCILYIIKSQKTTYSTIIKEEPETNITLIGKLIIVVCFFGIYTALITFAAALEYYLYDISVYSHLKFRRKEAVNLNSVYHTMVLISRICLIFILKVFPLKHTFHICLILGMVSSVILAVYGLDTKLLLWIFSSLTALFIIPVSCIAYAYVDRFIILTGKIAATIELGMGLGFILAGWALAAVFDDFGSQGLLVAFSLVIVVCNLLAFVVYLVGNHYGDRYDLIEEQEIKCQKHPLFASDTEDY